MGTEAIYFPEEYAKFMVALIVEGMNSVDIPPEMEEGLSEWCEGMTGYLEAQAYEDEEDRET